VQPIRKNKSDFSDLQASLDAYLNQDLEFSELRAQWIVALADNPELCSGAVRLLYEQPSDRHLGDELALSLKRIVEAAFDDGPDDSTVAFDDGDDSLTSPAEAISEETTELPAVSRVKSGRPQTTSPKASLRDSLKPGDVLENRFVLEERIGHGGIGIVYKAHDRLRQSVAASKAKIALKVLREEFRANKKQLSALQREAFQAQGLSHPNIVRVHDFHEDGKTCFITMELLEGELLRSLFSRLQPAVVPRDRAMRIIAGMCRGLAHAHGRGLVHADFKPGNVILTAGDEPKILDFGLSQAAVPGGRTGDVSSKPGSEAPRAITPAYASCNRLEGGAPGFSDDVYSLSCVIYELLAGRHPYARKSALVARELNLKPDRIKGLTELQWRTLATGLRPLRDARTTEVYDLLDAFTAPPPARALSVPVEKKKGREKADASRLTRILVATVLIVATVMLGLELVPSKYSESSPDVKGGPVTAMTDSASPRPTAVNERAALQTTDDPLSAPIDDVDSMADPSPILPDETVPPALGASAPGFQLESTEYFIPENGAALAVQISRQGDLSRRASVEWATVGDSAEPQLDYVGFDRRLVQFAAGEATQTIFIPIVSDTAAESDESFQVALSRPAGDMILAEPFTATVTIIDDDT
jgi:serine/threonine protein kinase